MNARAVSISITQSFKQEAAGITITLKKCYLSTLNLLRTLSCKRTLLETAVNIFIFGTALVPAIRFSLLSLKHLSTQPRTLLLRSVAGKLFLNSCKCRYFRDCPCTNKVLIIQAFHVSGRKQQFLKIVFVRGRLLANSQYVYFSFEHKLRAGIHKLF